MEATAVEVPPPGPGPNTDTSAVVGALRSEEGRGAVNCARLRKRVGRLRRFQNAVELLTKFAPNRESAKPGPPTVALDGDGDASVGTEFAVPAEGGTETG